MVPRAACSWRVILRRSSGHTVTSCMASTKLAHFVASAWWRSRQSRATSASSGGCIVIDLDDLVGDQVVAAVLFLVGQRPAALSCETKPRLSLIGRAIGAPIRLQHGRPP